MVSSKRKSIRALPSPKAPSTPEVRPFTELQIKSLNPLLQACHEARKNFDINMAMFNQRFTGCVNGAGIDTDLYQVDLVLNDDQSLKGYTVKERSEPTSEPAQAAEVAS